MKADNDNEPTWTNIALQSALILNKLRTRQQIADEKNRSESGRERTEEQQTEQHSTNIDGGLCNGMAQERRALATG